VSYNNYGVALAGYLVQSVSGMLFEEHAERHVLEPLSMNDSVSACGGYAVPRPTRPPSTKSCFLDLLADRAWIVTMGGWVVVT
jgi:CubicO group peptidase (beta-lactamase class C family)